MKTLLKVGLWVGIGFVAWQVIRQLIGGTTSTGQPSSWTGSTLPNVPPTGNQVIDTVTGSTGSLLDWFVGPNGEYSSVQDRFRAWLDDWNRRRANALNPDQDISIQPYPIIGGGGRYYHNPN